ncbi:uncharacterized protein AMSG_06896 [Thecamonas trahens ATCC 50062]|uniref:Uncharacterized protein n=1 Tax=Thecamonas trahens ATCC 50062 TaxID=461836 RepID=A0A0L0DDW1_THETB|nr:hypothetical protein AMSG_06896 [Thecamonas trahens ATCC 50062]KNC50405.1 hypothetical protein AMSG_06896 [Thecamonas trahens ATCC 50062]|eukprot:XP_013756947.1 hypothetical protein AMSG_06896 [Thecamonas trahens ATCC 50062]
MPSPSPCRARCCCPWLSLDPRRRHGSDGCVADAAGVLEVEAVWRRMVLVLLPDVDDDEGDAGDDKAEAGDEAGDGWEGSAMISMGVRVLGVAPRTTMAGLKGDGEAGEVPGSWREIFLELFVRRRWARGQLVQPWNWDLLLPGSRHASVSLKHEAMAQAYRFVGDMAKRVEVEGHAKGLSIRDQALWLRLFKWMDVVGVAVYRDLLDEQPGWAEIRVALPAAPQLPGTRTGFGQRFDDVADAMRPSQWVEVVVRRTVLGRRGRLRFNMCLVSSSALGGPGRSDGMVENTGAVTEGVMAALGLDAGEHTLGVLLICEYLVTAAASLVFSKLHSDVDGFEGAPPPPSQALRSATDGGLSIVRDAADTIVAHAASETGAVLRQPSWMSLLSE